MIYKKSVVPYIQNNQDKKMVTKLQFKTQGQKPWQKMLSDRE